ncbi:uncharacterized protein N7469_010756 [Penicillium citrinum]|uniref:Pyruvate decarboxylase n=1 Tax=Penicillium citrinum TaxID=5077 RepID=A0A9W9TGT4_PENCI|nr:uncharacterized protein N7469_010756 [Penicillium citrinum]KAJ5221869.1 hypothetical protein N7469_010756 [Penicillium citrinum]
MHLAEYLFRRLYELNIRSVFGVPGDFNLVALDYIGKCGLNWVGNVNELNAGYAADGYARVKGISAIFTTFGVGELSALNAIAGASAEFVPVIHVVGFPSTTAKEKRLPMHHTLGDGDYELFMEMSARISSAVAFLDSTKDARKMIDETIIQCARSSKPVYIGLPMDLVQAEIDATSLATPLPLEDSHSNPVVEEDKAISAVMNRISMARSPVILVDSLAGRWNGLHPTRAFVEKSNIPCFSFPMAKGVIDEGLPQFRGIYSASASEPGIEEQVQMSDLIIHIGPRATDLNTAGLKNELSHIETISFQRDSILMKENSFSNLRMNGVLRRLSETFCSTRSNSMSSSSGSGTSSMRSEESTKTDPNIDFEDSMNALLGRKVKSSPLVTQDRLWKREEHLLHESKSQKAPPPRKRRMILFIGDGSFQMTAQEVSTMVRHKLGVIIFVICNDGYTIERMIHGWDKSYNDIQPWDFQMLPAVFKPEPDSVRTYSVHTEADLDALLTDPQFGPASNFGDKQPPPLRLVEVHMAKEDAPQSLHKMVDAICGKKK